MTEKKFLGPRMLVLCSIFLFATQGLQSIWIIPYGAYWPEFYGVSMTPLGFGTTGMGIVGFVLGMGFVNTIIQKIGARGMMLIVTACDVITFLLWALVPELWAYYLAWGFLGVSACSIYVVVTHVIVRWYYHKRQKMIGIVLGVGTTGAFIMQAASGIVFPNLGLTGGFLLFCAIGFVAMFIPALFVSDKPEAFGQHALGYEDDPDYKFTEAAKADKGEDTSLKKVVSVLYRTPSFWLLLVAFFFVANGPTCITSYASYYMPMYGGLTVTDAANFVSLGSLGKAILVTFVIGAMVKKFHAKITLIVCAIFALAAFVFQYIYVTVSPTMGIMIPMYLTYVVGFCFTALSNYIAPDLYGTRLSTTVNAKIQGVMRVSGLYVAPTGAAILDIFGFPMVPVVLGVLFAVGFVFILLAMAVFQKRDKAKLVAAIDSEGGSATVSGDL